MFFYQQGVFILATGEAFDTASPADWQWNYDALGQVKSAIETSIMATRSCQYSYDQIGNRISSQKGNSPEVSYTSNSLNQYTVIEGSLTPSYDADGNQLNGLMPTVALPERGQFIFRYNAHNRPISVSKNTTILENYTHDHEGRRIQEGNTITIYDGYNAIAEYTVNGVLKTTYAWGLDLSNTLQGAGGVGGLLSVTDYTGQLPLISYPTYDGNGNVTEYVTEANNGTITAHYEYDAFGNVINTNNPNNTPTGKQYRYQFSTKPYNRLIGLNYYNYRDYDPVSGRWISPDPIEEQGGLNLYGFVGNNCVNYYDYTGLKKVNCPQNAYAQAKEYATNLAKSWGESFTRKSTYGPWAHSVELVSHGSVISDPECDCTKGKTTMKVKGTIYVFLKIKYKKIDLGDVFYEDGTIVTRDQQKGFLELFEI